MFKNVLFAKMYLRANSTKDENLQYLDDVGCETTDREYKVFTIYLNIIGKNDGFQLLKSGIWPFNDLIKRSIKSYIHKYFPKYFSTFSHPKSIINSASFFIGIDDDGLVHGIPYSGILTEEFVKKQILSTSDRFRGANNVDCVDKYMKQLSVKVILLNKTNYKTKIEENGLQLNFHSNMYQKLKEKMNIAEEKRSTYLAKKRRWEKFCNSTPQKITTVINDRKIRSQLIELIKKTSTSTTKLAPQYKNIYGYCEIKNDYWTMISDLKSDKKFSQVTFESAEKIRDNKLSPIYWAMAWRDKKLLPSKLLKPETYKSSLDYKKYSLLTVTQVPKMIPSWINNNSELNLYVIKITFPGNIEPKLFIEYQDSSKKWIQSYRTNLGGNPRCLHIF